MAALVFVVLHAGDPGVPAEVLAALEPGPAVLVQVADRGRPAAYVVAAPARREVEVFHLADPDLGYPEGLVVAAARFRDVDGRAFHDRYRRSPDGDAGPDQRVHFAETTLYREPDTVIHREERVPAVVQEHVVSAVDLSAKYLQWPAPGDWEPFVTFQGT